MQFSLRWLLAAIALVAVSLVALINANDLWRIELQSAILLSVLFASAGALWSVGRGRALCGGYVLFAIPFLIIFFGFKSRSEFISTRLLEAIHSRAFAPSTERTSGPFYPATHDGDVLSVIHQKDATLLVTAIRPKRQEFVAVGQAILSVFLAGFGALVAAQFYRRQAAIRGSLSH